MPKTCDDGRVIPVHRLRPNEMVWTPPSVIVLDSESQWHEEGKLELHQLRLWVATHVDRREVRKTQGPVTWGWGHSAGELAEWITTRTKGRESVWLYAHNLNYDLVLTNLAETMAELDWKVTEFSVSAGAPWLRLKCGRKVLTVVDSWSWLPQSLESLATLMGTGKLPLPANEGGEYEWLGRAARDVDITARAILALMDWWDQEELGRWTISGAGCGWNAMRHIDSHQRHIIDPEPELVAQDRAAVRGGRKDSAVVRAATGGPWVELDLKQAYPTVARELPLPMKRAWTFDSLPTDSPWLRSKFYGVVAEATIRTERPRYPVRHDGVTWYPVGTFKTVLAGPELAWAASNGDLVEIGPGQAHRLGLALRPWATWVLDPTRGGTKEVPAVGMVATKSWGRSVLGKFAARSHSSDAREGDAPAGWNVTDLWDRRVGRRGAEVSMQGQSWFTTYDGDTENCYPAVLAWVESEVRVRLGKVLEELDGAWWTCDTDGLLVELYRPHRWHQELSGGALFQEHTLELTAQALCDYLAPLVAPLQLRLKRAVHSLDVLGPQHLVVGDERRFSGVRSDAKVSGPGHFIARDWPKLKWQMEHSQPGVYTRPEREIRFSAPTVHRWVLADGSTRPVEFTLDDEGSNQLLWWQQSRWKAEGHSLAVHQYRRLDRVC